MEDGGTCLDIGNERLNSMEETFVGDCGVDEMEDFCTSWMGKCHSLNKTCLEM